MRLDTFVRKWFRICVNEYRLLTIWYFPTGLLRVAFYWPILRWHEHDREH
jgi:hypothetical protein